MQAEDENEEIIKSIRDLGIMGDGSDIEATVLELENRISEIHPDHKASQSDDRLQKLLALRGKLKVPGRELQRLSQSSSLIKRQPATQATISTVGDKITGFTESAIRSTTKRFLAPRISLGVVATALTSVFLFPNTFKDHPFIAVLLKSRWAILIWAIAVSILSISWFLVGLMERKEKCRIQRFLSLSHHKTTLRSVCHGNRKVFSESQLQAAFFSPIAFYPKWFRTAVEVVLHKKLYYFHNPFYDETLIEQATQLALQRFIERGWIRKTTRPEDEDEIDDWYELTNA